MCEGTHSASTLAWIRVPKQTQTELHYKLTPPAYCNVCVQAVVDAFPDVKELLMQDFPEMSNSSTLFAPSNKAFGKLLAALGDGVKGTCT